MLIAVPANAVRFRSSLAACGPEHILITERAGLVERQRGAGLVSGDRQNANGSTVGGAIPRNQLTGGGVQHQRGHCRRFRTQSAGRGCGIAGSLFPRLVMGKGFFVGRKHPLHWCVQQIVNGIRCRVTCSQRCGTPASDDPAQCHCAPVHSVVLRPECGSFHGHTREFCQHACLFFASVSLLTVEDPHNAAVYCDPLVICAFTSGCAALAFSPSVAGTTSVT